MTPQDRIKRYAQLATLATILVWGMLCFFLIVSPKAHQLERTESELSQSSKKVAGMRKEIENASIAGTPAPGESRYEKFGILGADEEQLFLSDLIEFCKDTRNTLNVVRRATTARRTTTATPEDQKKGGRSSSSTPGEDPNVPRPVIQRVPHTVNYSGTFISSFYLLRKLESYKRLLTVERVEIATDTRNGYPRVNGNITIDLYLVRHAAPPPATAAEAQEEEAAVGAEAASGDSETEADAGGQE